MGQRLSAPFAKSKRRNRDLESFELSTDAEHASTRSARYLRKLREDMPAAAQQELIRQDEDVQTEHEDIVTSRTERALRLNTEPMTSEQQQLARNIYDTLVRLTNKHEQKRFLRGVLYGKLHKVFPYMNAETFHMYSAMRARLEHTDSLLDPRIQRSKLYLDQELTAKIRDDAKRVLKVYPCGHDVLSPGNAIRGDRERTDEQVNAIVESSTTTQLFNNIVNTLKWTHDPTCRLARPYKYLRKWFPPVVVVLVQMHSYVPFDHYQDKSVRRLRTFRMPSNLALSRITEAERTKHTTPSIEDYMEQIQSSLRKSRLNPLAIASKMEDVSQEVWMENTLRDDVVRSAMRDKGSKPDEDAKRRMDRIIMLAYASKARAKHFLPRETVLDKTYKDDPNKSGATLFIPGMAPISLRDTPFFDCPAYRNDHLKLSRLMKWFETLSGVYHVILLDLSCQDFDNEEAHIADPARHRALLGGF
jgi:hypothetical protein